jgi:hypothetical protein
MTDYTPTTDEVREWYGDDVTDADRAWELAKRAEFDRWLAAHDEEVLDKAARRAWEILRHGDQCWRRDSTELNCECTVKYVVRAIRGEGDHA